MRFGRPANRSWFRTVDTVPEPMLSQTRETHLFEV
ncbi:hypothetical protein RCH11_003725 [Glaciihabitans sp. GrIS 2.15]|nr:hypothetical protein [Glaciihabitans sp. GrIS 2.15]